jgi:hypothetical protein
MIDFDAYQAAALATAIYPNRGANIGYAALGLGEVGELQGKIKKIERDMAGAINEQTRMALLLEMGDSLWYVAATAYEAGIELGIAQTISATGHDQPMSLKDTALLLGGAVGTIQMEAARAGMFGKLHALGRGQIKLALQAIIMYLASMAEEHLDSCLQEIADLNLAKLGSRSERGTLTGSGDYR